MICVPFTSEREKLMTHTNISRRSFTFGGATLLSSLLLPSIPGIADAFSVIPFGTKCAWADDVSSSSTDSDSTEIMVVGRTQLGIVAYDVTDPDSLVSVPHCTVTITSLFNGEELTGTSDEKGRIIFDIGKLAEDTSAEIIGFNGSILITCEGYRDVYIPLTRITAHAALIAPTRPLDDKPYLRTASFNGWDIQYTQAEFMTSATSTAQNVVEIEMWMPQENMTPTATLVKEENERETNLGSFAFGKPVGKLVKGSVSGQYLLSSSAVCVGEDAVLKVDFSFEEANSEYRNDLALFTTPAPVDDNESGSQIIIPSTKYSSFGTIFDIPESMCPPFKGVSFTTWKPEFPVFFDINIFGYAVFGGGTTSVKVHDNNGSVLDKDHWKQQPSLSIKEQAKQEWQLESGSMKAALASGVDPSGKVRGFTYAPTRKFTCKGNLQAYAKEEWLRDEQLWQCDFAALASLRYDFAWMIRFTIMGIPGFFHFTPFFQGQASFDVASKSDDAFSFDFHANSTMQFGIDFTFGISITLGVGVSGIASVSGTGTGYLCFGYNFAPNPGHYYPRMTAGWGASLIVTVQAPFCKLALKLYAEDKPQACDSNNMKSLEGFSAVDKNSSEWTHGNLDTNNLDSVLLGRLGSFAHVENPVAGTGEFPTFAQFKEMAAIVTNAELLSSKEFERTRAGDYEHSSVVVTTDSLLSATDVWESETPVTITVMTAPDAATTTPADDAPATVAALTSLGADALLSTTAADASYLPQYTYVGSMEQNSPIHTLGVGGLSDGARGGVRPGAERVMFRNVYSDSHLHLLTTKGWGGTYVFRIASVDNGSGQARSRLVYHQLLQNGNWSQPYIVDFDPHLEGVAREDVYDYDFSVTQANANTGANYIFLLVTSGTREGGDNINFVRNLQAHYASLVCLYESGDQNNPLLVDPAMTAPLPATADGSTLTNPRITGFSDTFSVAGTNDFCVMGTYACRAVDENEGISSASQVMSFFARNELDATYTQKVFNVTTSRVHLAGDSALHDMCMLPVKIDDESYSWQYGSVANCRRSNLVYSGSDFSGMCKFEALYENNDSTQFKNFVFSNLASIDSSKTYVNKFYPWGNDGEVLATCECENDDGAPTSGFFHVTFDPKNQGSATFTPIGPRAGSVADFVVDGAGHFLFFPENMDGTVGQTRDDAGDVKPDGAIIEHRHYIKAVAQVDGLFTEPFVFCEVDHIIDALVATTVNGSYVTFLTSSITDINNSRCDIYDVRVPLLKCITPVALLCESAFALSGEQCPFSVKVRNDGNLVATAATFTLYDEEGEVVDERHIDFSSDLLSSARDVDADCGYDVDNLSSAQKQSKLVANDGLGVLVPGKTQTMRMTFAIPEDWHDKRTVHIGISNVDVIVPTGLSSEGLQDYFLGAQSLVSSTFEVNSVSVDSSGVGAGKVQERSKGSDEWDNGNNSDTASKTKDSTQKGALARTSDASLGCAAALALGAAGAGFAAYSARRVANERAQANECARVNEHGHPGED